jgi:hypothetical protein
MVEKTGRHAQNHLEVQLNGEGSAVREPEDKIILKYY